MVAMSFLILFDINSYSKSYFGDMWYNNQGGGVGGGWNY